MTTWSKCDEEVALKANNAQDVHSDIRVSTSIRNTESSVCGRKYILCMLWTIGAVIIAISTVLLIIVVLHKVTLGGGDDLSCTIMFQNYTAPDIESNMNRDVDPCDNFYEFACGGWEANNALPKGLIEWNIWAKQAKMFDAMILELTRHKEAPTKSIAFQQAMMLYQKCMEVEHQDGDGKPSVLKFINEALEFYGGWPIISGGDQWNPRNFNWIKSFVSLTIRFKKREILDINSYRDVHNVVGMNYVNISKPLPDLADLPMFSESNSYIVDLSKEIMKSKNVSNFSEVSLHKQASRIKQIHNRLTNLSRLDESNISEFRKRHGFSENFGFTTLSGLQEMLDEVNISGNTINMLELLKLLYKQSGVDIAGNTMLYINDISYLLNVQEYILSLDTTDLANYLHFKMVHGMTPSTTKELRGLYFKGLLGFRVNLTKRGEAECTAAVRTRLRFVLESKLAEKEYGSANCFEKSRDETRRMLELLKTVFRNAKYTSSVLHANYSTNICIAFPDWIFDDNALQMEYTGLDLSLPTYLQQVLAFNEWQTIKHQRTPILPLGIKNCDWSLLEHDVAYAEPDQNQIYLNWKMFMPPYFAIGDHDKSHNFGAMGTILAHEFAHNMDIRDLVRMWSDDAHKELKAVQ